MIGQTLGHYRILEQIGAGGMGVVYRARDERLDRDVALKVLPAGTLTDEAARKRFRKEALSLSRLNHPNIATVHDFDSQEGIDFLVTELIPGVTLDDKLTVGPLPEKDVIQIGMQLAEGLEAAHRQGVIHRDLKPANLRLTPEGRLKILDFGLAQRVGPADPASVTQSVMQAGPAGTLAYMSPEQLKDEKVDARADLWAAGMVLYELATGRRPFEGKSSTALADQILHSAPPGPQVIQPRVSPRLADVILKCLEKDPENRYQSAKELMVDLRRLSGTTVTTASVASPVRPARGQWPVIAGVLAIGLIAALVYVYKTRQTEPAAETHIRSLAVLPLANLSGDPEQEYFADGITEAMITELAQISALRVISRTSVMSYKGGKKSLPEIARELHVDGILEGSVVRSGGKVRITAQLIQAVPERHLWAKAYDRDLRDVLAIQSEVARAVAEEIRVKLTPQEQSRLQKTQTVNPEAHDAYLRGRYHWNLGEPQDVEKARAYFEEALKKDPLYAPAYSGLSDYYSVLPFYTNARPDDVFPKAKAAVTKALELDDSLAEAHASLAYIQTYYEWDWDAAGREFQRALALNPNDPNVRHRYSRYLSSLGRIEDAVREARRAQELDPLSTIIKANVGVIYYFGRKYDLAIGALQEVLKEDQNFSTAHWGLGLAYEQKGMQPEAIAEFEKADALSKHRSNNTIASLSHAYAAAGQAAKAQKLLDELESRRKPANISGYQFAIALVGAGKKDQAFAELEKAFRERSTLLGYLKMDPRLDPLRSDPRFQDLQRRVGLSQ